MALPTILCTYLGVFVGVVGVLVGRSGGGSRCILSAGLLSDHVEHTVLEGLLVLAQPVLLPGVVIHIAVEVVSSHAVREETFACAVVGLLLEFQASAVLHELSEFGWMTAAQLFKRRFNLLLLDRVVLLVLATAGQALPG